MHNYISDHSLNIFRVILLNSVVLIGLSACSDEQPEITTPPEHRSVQTAPMQTSPLKIEHRLPGRVAAKDNANLSFGMPGDIHEILVDIGDEVVAGQVIARLDSAPFQSALAQASAALNKAQGYYAEYHSDYVRQTALRDDNATSARALEHARALYFDAKYSVKESEAGVNLAQRDLSRSIIVAPYNGFIGARFAEAGEDVGAGQPIFSIDRASVRIVEAVAPTSLQSTLAVGDEVQIRSLDGRLHSGRLLNVNQRASNGFGINIKAEIESVQGQALLIGSVVEMIVTETGSERLSLVPHNAVIPQQQGQSAVLFTVHPDSSLVTQHQITVVATAKEGFWVSGNMSHTNMVVANGAAFLSDGDKVNLVRGGN